MKFKNVRIVCAWCNADMGQKNGWSLEGVSHSICSDCLIEWRKAKANGTIFQSRQAQERTFATTMAQSLPTPG
jgi:hypothetical protein